jgi:hypothetical protein
MKWVRKAFSRNKPQGIHQDMCDRFSHAGSALQHGSPSSRCRDRVTLYGLIPESYATVRN